MKSIELGIKLTLDLLFRIQLPLNAGLGKSYVAEMKLFCG